MQRLQHRATYYIIGFALPTVLLSSVVLLALLMTALQTVVSVRMSMIDQRYEQLARTASESGIAHAESCLRNSNQLVTWSDSSKLYPQTTCTGGQKCQNSSSCYVLSSSTEKTWYEVLVPTEGYAATQSVTVRGVAELTSRSTNRVVKSYEHTSRARVGANVSFSTVAFGYNTSGAYFTAVGDNGLVYGVGNNSDGQLGNGTTASSVTQTPFTLPSGVRAASSHASFLSVGRHTYVITNNGSIYAAGMNSSGQLGIGTINSPVTAPVRVALPSGETARYVVPLHFTTYFVTNSDKVYSAGSCARGSLGDGVPVSEPCANAVTPVRVVLPASAIPTRNFVADRLNASFLAENGAVYGWGHNDYGQLADGGSTPTSTPKIIGGYDGVNKKARHIGIDGMSTYIVDMDGSAWASGSHFNGQLGIGVPPNDTRYRTLQRMALPDSAGKVLKVSTDQWSVSLLTDTGEVWSAGRNDRGQLGNGTTTTSGSLVKFQLPAGVKAIDVYNTSIGDTNDDANNIFVIGDNGRVYGAGANLYGQLGDGTTISRSVPVAMRVFDGISVRAVGIRSGLGTTVVLSADGKIYTVGNNSHGQLGDGTTTNSTTPNAHQFTNILRAVYH